jgi:RNA polymerase sigma-70 factor (ECF subfamily)
MPLSRAPGPAQRDAGLDELLGQVARGDTAAFERLYDQVAGAVYGLAVRMLRDSAQAEEVAQEVLIQVWRKAAAFDPSRGGAMTWIMTLAHRRTVDRVRSEQASAAREDQAGRREIPAPADGVAEMVLDRLDRQRVRDCLGSLTGAQRESITLAYYDGYTYPEVAARAAAIAANT